MRVWELSTPHGTLGTGEVGLHSEVPPRLSTPHGTLGTKQFWYHHSRCRMAFNSTRYIRNILNLMRLEWLRILSTPHGTLGTHKELGVSRATYYNLSTPHGTLGTEEIREVWRILGISFNSTRYIRNRRFRHGMQIRKGHTFNSTRYIRNRSFSSDIWSGIGTFNSTRYIRNSKRPH